MKIINKILGVTTLLLLLNSCSNNFEEDVFDKSASERAKESITNYKNILVSSEHGWALEQYAGGKKMRYGGFMHTLEFTETQVKSMMVWYGSRYAPESSYSVIANGGPTLVIDTFNPVYHYMSQPFWFSPDGNQAESEFVLMSYKDGILYLKGKKHGIETRLTKLEEPASTFMDKVSKISNSLDTPFGGSYIKTIKVNEKEIGFRRESSALVFIYEKDGKSFTDFQPYIINSTGMHFYNPVSIYGVTFQDLVYDFDKKLFKTDDDKVFFYR